MNYHGIGVESSRYAVKLVQSKLPAVPGRLLIVQRDFLEMDLRDEFDFVFVLEVLEHMNDDERCLWKISSFLRPGGKCFLSVPAHMRHWTSHDQSAGHLRRYEKDNLVTKLPRTGFTVLTIWNYGFPLSNFLFPLRSFAAHRISSTSMKERTAISGTYHPLEQRFRPLLDLITKVVLPLQLWLQGFFLDRDFGIGYVVLAQKKQVCFSST